MYKLSSYGKYASISFVIGFILFNLIFSEDILMVPSGITISGLENNLLFINKYLLDILSGYISLNIYGSLQLWVVLIFGFLLDIILIYLLFSIIEHVVKEIKHGSNF